MALVIAQIHENDMALKPYYQMHIKDIVSESNVDRYTAYKEVKKGLKDLMVQIWEFEDIRTNRFAPKHIVDTSKNLAEDGFEFGYNNGVITIILNPALKAFFLHLGHYTTYSLSDYMKFKSWYSMRLYEILEAYKDTGQWFVKIDEYRILMDCQNKYPQPKDMIKYTLNEPLQELKGTRMEFEYSLIYPKEKSRGRPPIVALEFRLKNVELRKIPKHWYEDENNARLIEKLKEFKVSEANIVKYGPYIPMRQTSKMIREWQIKEQSNERIDEFKKYCNAVWVRVGKKYVK